jgi:hypothetical protein
LALLFLLVAAGCTAQPKAPEDKPKLQSPWSEPDEARPRAGSAFDPCAERLHELCRPLLMHYAIHRRMPAGLDDLRRMAGPDPAIVFECPVSKQTYGYQPDGLGALTTQGRIVMYDPTPAHDGKRWAVVLEETKPGQPLIPRVVSIPEAEFPRLRGPQTQPAGSVE